MCNDFGNHIPYSDYLAAFSQTRIPVRWPTSAPNLEPREDIWPTDKAPVVRRLEDGTNEFSEIRWGFPPGRPKGSTMRASYAPASSEVLVRLRQERDTAHIEV